MQTDRWTDTTKRTAAFRNFANAPQNTNLHGRRRHSFYTVGDGSMFLYIVDNHLPDHTVSHCRTVQSVYHNEKLVSQMFSLTTTLTIIGKKYKMWKPHTSFFSVPTPSPQVGPNILLTTLNLRYILCLLFRAS